MNAPYSEISFYWTEFEIRRMSQAEFALMKYQNNRNISKDSMNWLDKFIDKRNFKCLLEF